MEATKKKFLKNMVGFSMATWIAAVIGLIASPIATRLFTTEEMGKLNMFSLYASLFSATCYLGLDQAYVRFFSEPPGRCSRGGLFTFCATTSLGVGLLTTLISTFWWRGLSEQIMTEPDFAVFACLAVYGLCMIVFRYLSLSYRMEQNARQYTIQMVLQVLLIKVAYLAIAFHKAEARPSIFLQTALIVALTAVFAVIQRKRFIPGELKLVTRPFVREVSAFAAPLIPLAVMSWLNNSVSLVVLRNLMGVSAVGVYSSGLVLVSTVNIIQTGFNAYWTPYVYENYKQDDNKRFYTVHRLMACLLTGFGLTLTLLQGVVYLLFGARFRGSMIYFPFLFLTPICYCLSETTGMGIGISKKSYWNTLIFLIASLVNIGMSFLLVPLLQETGAAIAAAVSAVVALIIRTAAGERYYKAISNYRYLVYTIGLMLLAAAANYLLRDDALLKYGALIALYALALYLYRKEIATLLHTARQALHEVTGAWKRGGKHTADKGEPT